MYVRTSTKAPYTGYDGPKDLAAMYFCYLASLAVHCVKLRPLPTQEMVSQYTCIHSISKSNFVMLCTCTLFLSRSSPSEIEVWKVWTALAKTSCPLTGATQGNWTTFAYLHALQTTLKHLGVAEQYSPISHEIHALCFLFFFPSLEVDLHSESLKLVAALLVFLVHWPKTIRNSKKNN